jgi:hypothetical protein
MRGFTGTGGERVFGALVRSDPRTEKVLGNGGRVVWDQRDGGESETVRGGV